MSDMQTSPEPKVQTDSELQSGKSKFREGMQYFWTNYSVAFAFIVLFILASFASEHFLSPLNITNMLRQVSVIGILAIGMTFVILIGGIDLSVGSVLALAGTVIMASQVDFGTSIFTAVLFGLLAGAVVGIVNGIVITYGKIAAFITTLAMMTIARSTALYYADAGAISGLNSEYTKIGNEYLLGIPIPVYIFATVVVIAFILLEKTTFGRHIYAVGGNSRAAHLSAVPITRITIMAYMICGLTAAIGAVIETSRLNSVSTSSSGSMYELDAIAAVIIGGTKLTGGQGRIIGTVFGILILAILSNIMNLMNISPYIQGVVKGGIILVAVLLQKRN